MKIVCFLFVEGYEYDGHEQVKVYVDMSTDGTKTFSAYGMSFENYSYPSQEELELFPFELVDSGITRIIDSDFLDGWVDLLLFGGIYHVEITSIKYTKGNS